MVIFNKLENHVRCADQSTFTCSEWENFIDTYLHCWRPDACVIRQSVPRNHQRNGRVAFVDAVHSCSSILSVFDKDGCAGRAF